MRRDMNIMKSIEMRNSLENEYGCCLRNDLSGCVQTAQSQCSNRTSFWIKWPNRSGPVCGNDPRYCMDKSMNISYEKNITDWPICNQYDNEAIYRSKDLHMKCKVQGKKLFCFCLSFVYCKSIFFCRFVKLVLVVLESMVNVYLHQKNIVNSSKVIIILMLVFVHK